MTRFGLLTFCMILGVAPLGCSSSSDNGGEGGSGTGGSTVGTGGSTVGSGGSTVGSGGSTVGSGGAAGTTGTQSKTAVDVVMRGNEVAGWTLDPDNPKTKGKVAATATNEIDTEYLIDGSAADFFRAFTPKMFAWQTYVSSTVPNAPEGAMVSLYILEMASAADASGLYAFLPTDANEPGGLYKRKRGTPDDWVDPASATLGSSSRIQDTGDTWWINFCKGNFYIEVSLNPSQGPAPDYEPGNQKTKVEAFKFAQAVSDKI